jgi:preprotein translocase subunit SecE
VADSKPSKTTKRRLRAPSQTVRQQAVKAQAEAGKPQKVRRLRRAAGAATKPFGRIASALDRQPFRAIGKVFSIIGRLLAPKFIRNTFTELKFVTWPTRKQTRQLTFAVLMFAIVFGVVITVVDYGLDKLFRAIILK